MKKHPRERFLMYMRWHGMKQRCYNPNNMGYRFYGARGVTICERWLKSFEAFYDDMGPCPPGRSLDRIDGTKGYGSENCRWATNQEQGRNRRTDLPNGPSPAQLAFWEQRRSIAKRRGLSTPPRPRPHPIAA